MMSDLDKINNLLLRMPENQLSEILDFLMFLQMKNDKAVIHDIESASLSSTDFWNNPDDEVWDNV